MNSIAGIFRTYVLPVNGGKCEELRICEIANMSHLGTIDTCVKLSYIFQNITMYMLLIFKNITCKQIYSWKYSRPCMIKLPHSLCVSPPMIKSQRKGGTVTKVTFPQK